MYEALEKGSIFIYLDGIMLKHGYEQFCNELLEECSCKNRRQLDNREGKLLRELKPMLKNNIAGRTPRNTIAKLQQ